MGKMTFENLIQECRALRRKEATAIVKNLAWLLLYGLTLACLFGVTMFLLDRTFDSKFQYSMFFRTMIGVGAGILFDCTRRLLDGGHWKFEAESVVLGLKRIKVINRYLKKFKIYRRAFEIKKERYGEN